MSGARRGWFALPSWLVASVLADWQRFLASTPRTRRPAGIRTGEDRDLCLSLGCRVSPLNRGLLYQIMAPQGRAHLPTFWRTAVPAIRVRAQIAHTSPAASRVTFSSLSGVRDRTRRVRAGVVKCLVCNADWRRSHSALPIYCQKKKSAFVPLEAHNPVSRFREMAAYDRLC